jgi:predicted SprT family Zn-dependent metalloprotease
MSDLTDPNPDVFALFVHYNQRYFSGKLDAVSVSWSKRMTLCAGVCKYSQNGPFHECTISLSEPLLKFRPSTDTINTLLHEMIHAYMFVTKNIKDNSAHGPEFQRIMGDINSREGTQITIYHSFHAEVDFYRVHWWKCSKCDRIVKRSMNRAPSKWDDWWSAHVRSCGGDFVKIKGPEKKKPVKAEKKKPSIDPNGSKVLDKFLDKGKPIPKRKTVEAEVPNKASEEKRQKIYDRVIIDIDDERDGYLWPVPKPIPKIDSTPIQKPVDWFGRGTGPLVYTPFSQVKNSKTTPNLNDSIEIVNPIPTFSLEIPDEEVTIEPKVVPTVAPKVAAKVDFDDDEIEIIDTLSKVCPLCNKPIEYSFEREFKIHVSNCTDTDIDIDLLDD